MNDALATLLEALSHPWVRAAAVVLASMAIAKMTDALVSRFLVRLALRTHSDLDDRLIELMHRPVFLSVILTGLYVALRILKAGPETERILVASLQTAAIVIWTGAGFKLSSATLAGLSRLADRVTWLESRTLPLFENLSKIVVLAVAVYCFLIAWRLDLTPWLASAGIMGIAVGFAAKDTLANLFGGLFVIMDAPYKIGDYINLDSGERGEVVKIGLRSTRLMTRDDVEITLPNAHIANAKVVNESGGPHEKTRVVVQVGVAYGSDVEEVHAVLLAAAQSVPSVVADPAPYVRFIEMGDSALLFRIQAWVDAPAQRGACIDGLNTAIYQALGRAQIEIPFPQRVVHAAPPPPSAD
ncbi:MAG: mechanosensitive ion channel family protein [Myxococcota bacterium]|nr:mechanosensitive ion channel family protein [Myxococcota bacterium]